MEDQTPIEGDKTPETPPPNSDEPPPAFNYPKPDFSEMPVDDTSGVSTPDKSESVLQKPTFKSALQAKKRLQAYSSSRAASLPSSPLAKKLKTATDEKSDEGSSPKKSNKKGVIYHDDKAKAVIEEIEEIKRHEQAKIESMKNYNRRSRSRSKSRSRSQDKERFKKVDKKSRNYRRRSATPEKHRKVHKKPKKYPKNWKEFVDLELDFDLNKDVDAPKGNNELLRQMLFESPSLPITQFKMKTANGKEEKVPFEYIRYTRSKPVVAFSVNFNAIKEGILSKKVLLEALPKETVANIENLFSNSLKFNMDMKSTSRNWFLKDWKEYSEECKLLEKSVGLSFLQSYTEEEESAEVVEEAAKEAEVLEVKNSKKHKDKQKKKSKKVTEESKKDKVHAEEDDLESKVKTKEKAKQPDDNVDEKVSKKRKKDKKDKLKKKEKRHKEKKLKKKKSKSKKKKVDEKIADSLEKSEKPTKQQVIEELKIIEEKLAKKRELNKKENEEKSEKSRKRKNSEREEDSKIREKHQKRKKKSTDSKKKQEKDKTVDICESTKTDAIKEHKKADDTRKRRRTKTPEENRKLKALEDIVNDSQKVIEEIEMKLEGNIKKEDSMKNKEERTPDTDEYHSHWESDDGMSSSARRKPIKNNRSWESDEELFERTYLRNKTQPHSYTNLEIPLNIKGFSRRSKWDEKPIVYNFDTQNEFRLLDEERKALSEERKKLELEKQKIRKLQEDCKLGLDDKKSLVVNEVGDVEEKDSEDIVKVKKEAPDVADFSIDSLNNSLLSNVSSVDSTFPITALENEYEEFMKAVSSDSSTQKKKVAEDPGADSSSSSDSDHKKKKKRSKSKKKKKKRRRECDGLLPGKVNNIFDEFDIPVPSEIPEMIPTIPEIVPPIPDIAPIPAPVPVPSPVPLISNSSTSSASVNLLLSSIVDFNEKEKSVIEEKEIKSDQGLDLSKPFIFSSITLPSKKPLLDNSNLKLNDDSDSADFTDKFVTKKHEEPKKSPKEDPPPTEEAVKPLEPPQTPSLSVPESAKPQNSDPAKIEPVKESPKKTSEPPPPPKEKKRSRSRSRDRRRSPKATPPSRRRYSPRRRSSPRRRGLSPRRRSPSPRRRSPLGRRRRRSPSLSPVRRGRKRTPSPRIRRASPLNSPLDGFKKSVADSTISDDMLPQPTPEDYTESPPSFGRRRRSLSPASPRRIPLDERINQVLGLEKDDEKRHQHQHHQQHPVQVFQGYPQYGGQFEQQHYPQYGQYGQFPQKTDYPPQYGPMFTQPPPPIVKQQTAQPPTKVVQVGNILQVVPNDDVITTVPEPKVPECTQKIVQVGNMLQIVPGANPPQAPVLQEIAPVPELIPPPEIQSAEAVMKQKNAERKAEREKRRQEREKRRKDKEKKRKEKEKRKQMKLKLKTENMIKRALMLETEALAVDEAEEEEEEGADENVEDLDVQWPPTPITVISSSSPAKSILLTPGSSKKRKSVQFADGVRPGEGTSPSGGEELSSPPPQPPKLPKEKRYKKLKIPKKNKKKKVKVKVVKKPQTEDEDDEDDNLPPPSPPPGSPPPHVFPSRVKTHTINNVHQYVGGIIQTNPPQFAFRPPMPHMVINRAPTHQPPPGYLPSPFHADMNSMARPPPANLGHPPPGSLAHQPPPGMIHQPPPMNSIAHPPPAYQGVQSHH